MQTRKQNLTYKGRTPFHRLYMSKAEALLMLNDMREAEVHRGNPMDATRANLYLKLTRAFNIIPSMLTAPTRMAEEQFRREQIGEQGDPLEEGVGIDEV